MGSTTYNNFVNYLKKEFGEDAPELEYQDFEMTINRSILEYVDNLNNEGNSIQDEDEQ
jgi:hypothetical protein